MEPRVSEGPMYPEPWEDPKMGITVGVLGASIFWEPPRAADVVKDLEPGSFSTCHGPCASKYTRVEDCNSYFQTFKVL